MATETAVELAPGVWRIPTLGDFINSFAFVDDDGSLTLVDCGVEKAPPRIVAGLATIGKHPADVQRIVLTHTHPDHAGGAADLAARTGARVAVHEHDADSAEAGRVLARPDPSIWSGRLFNRINKGAFPAFDVADRLTDEQVLPVGGGLRVVHTPGHSPGHVALLHEASRVLITGDSIMNFLGRRIRWSPRFLCHDFAMNERTAHALGELEYDVAAFTHGPEIRDRAREQVRGFVRQLGG